MMKTFAAVVIDVAVLCEFTGPDLLDEDTAVPMLEGLASRLGDMDDAERAGLAAEFTELSHQYTRSDIADFVRGLPHSLGLV